MNGLDITSWIEQASTANMIRTIGFVMSICAGVFFFIAGGQRVLDRDETRRAVGKCFMASLIVLTLSVVVFLAGAHMSNSFSDDRFEAYVAHAYGVSSLDCGYMPDDYLDGMSDLKTCTVVSMNGGMSTEDDAMDYLDLIIHDNHAYLYGENGNLMPVVNKQGNPGA